MTAVLNDDMQLFKQFTDNEGFRRWLTDNVFGLTYAPPLSLPFAALIPNATTIKAMKEARKGDLPQFDSVQALMDDLHAQD